MLRTVPESRIHRGIVSRDDLHYVIATVDPAHVPAGDGDLVSPR